MSPAAKLLLEKIGEKTEILSFEEYKKITMKVNFYDQTSRALDDRTAKQASASRSASRPWRGHLQKGKEPGAATVRGRRWVTAMAGPEQSRWTSKGFRRQSGWAWG